MENRFPIPCPMTFAEARTLFSIQPGDTLLLLADEKRGLAIPEKGSFASLFQQAFRENPQVEP